MLKQMLQKEFILVLRDKHSLAALFIMPFFFILIMSMALKDTFTNERALLIYEIVDLDNSQESKMLQDFMSTSSFLQRVDSKDSSDTHLSITIPKSFSNALLEKERQEPLLQLSAAPDVKQEMIMIFQAKLSADIMRLRLMQIQKKIAPYIPDASQLNLDRFHNEKLFDIDYRRMQDNEQPTSTQQSVPSWIVFGMFFVIIPMSTVFINERKQKTLMRLASMNISIPALFTGKVLPYLLINQLQVLLMIAAGVYIVPLLGGDALTPGHSLAGLALVSISLSFAAIGTSVLIATLAKTVEQATTVGGLINILFGAIGGIMVPKFYMPESMQKFANISPMSWGLEGFLDIFLRGYGIKEILPEAMALCGFGLCLLLLAATILSKRLRG
ncbi:MAG: ABC transporter permease [Thermodesulfobacteriota bacterium]|nr:ABC transporter permease [Thermodesulfobacteriota bacterium]